ncbi:MAG: ImmA/IrrE family metallo-endopeptidase [Actinomycetaceae bacterium]|jgi:Zn-dependent peptidase ImmA (M78 family)|nr:ImmA/IrrE family metallo-endopeptidase [Actinomycetaceae bacterium]
MFDFSGKTVGEIRKAAREHAKLVRTTYKALTIPVNPVAVARAMGASVFIAELGDDVYGMLINDDAGPNIYIDRDQPAVRQRFTCAHEVGHLYSHLGDTRTFVDARSDEGRGTASEIYANEFAAELLMPEEELRTRIDPNLSDLDQYSENSRLAREFDVSLSALVYRRKLLNV